MEETELLIGGKELRKIRKCFVCGKTNELYLAHLISHPLAEVIVSRQFKETLFANGYRKLADVVYKVRNQKGDVWLCKEHHKISDDTQKNMVNALEMQK